MDPENKHQKIWGEGRDSKRTLALREIPIEQAFAPSPQFLTEPTGLQRVTVRARKALRGAWSTEHRLRRIGDGLNYFFWVVHHKKAGTLQSEQVKALMTLTLS